MSNNYTLILLKILKVIKIIREPKFSPLLGIRMKQEDNVFALFIKKISNFHSMLIKLRKGSEATQ